MKSEIFSNGCKFVAILLSVYNVSLLNDDEINNISKQSMWKLFSCHLINLWKEKNQNSKNLEMKWNENINHWNSLNGRFDKRTVR